VINHELRELFAVNQDDFLFNYKLVKSKPSAATSTLAAADQAPAKSFESKCAKKTAIAFVAEDNIGAVNLIAIFKKRDAFLANDLAAIRQPKGHS